MNGNLYFQELLDINFVVSNNEIAICILFLIFHIDLKYYGNLIIKIVKHNL